MAVLAVTIIGCKKRDIADLQAVEFPKNGDVFIDDFTGDLQFAAFGGSDVRAFQIETRETYNNSRQSMRFDVPDANSASGSYAGGVFYSTVGRNLTNFNALTFYIKANVAVNIGEIGFGNDLGENKFVVSISNLPVTSGWRKVIIPIPDAAKLTAERGLLYLASGPINNRGYTFWVDEVKFEKLGTVVPVESSIMNGTNTSITTFIGVTTPITGLTSTFNLPNGVNQTVNLSRNYFVFNSSNAAVATISNTGVATSVSAGTSVITATVAGVQARGSLTINCQGVFTRAPIPTRSQADVISIFSDAYTNVPVNYYNGYWAPFQTTVSNDFTVQGDNVLNYNNFNFVGIEFSAPTVNATSMTHFHMNAFFPGTVAPGRQLRVILVDFGANGVFGGGDDTRHSTTFTTPTLVSRSWVTIDIPLANMTGLGSRNNIAQIIFEGGDGSTMYVDNVYFYRIQTAPTTAAPTPTRPAANVLSVFSNAYTNIPGTDFNPNWGQSTQVSQLPIAGNTTLRYANFNYQGTQFATAQNVSTFTNFHIDYFSANATTLRVFLISPGPVERSFTLTVPTSGWNSVDIPMSAFNGVNLSNVIQLKFDGGTGSDVFLDNLYFWR
ncbi:MAG: glycosyl hydrolase family 16 [Bacteroidetes bacterium]|nr:MAG: glycosyl hydrolase family 16 [Bacteroidota bacterium]TAF93161.1 MAG: glycosyl hydrolase family 16 [Bacteroidota bacterium]